MSFPNIIQDIVEIQTYIENIKSNIIDFIYPVGSIYMSVNNVSPQIFLGGEWEQIEDTFLLSAGSKHTAGSTGGEESHILSVAESPSHTHTRGTMNITGNTQSFYHYIPNTGGDGCFVTKSREGGGVTVGSSTYTGCGTATFDASRNWTGETSSVGNNQPHNNMPPYLTVYMWKRIS